MRKIEKQTETPSCLSTFIDNQLQTGPPVVNLWYWSFPRKRQLLMFLTEEQFGLCGYTGAPVDKRIGNFDFGASKIILSNHIEHLKCQATCKTELENEGLEHGHDLGEDLSYFNMIAALEIRGAEEEHFGAVFKKNNRLPVWPTHDGCESRFKFREADGSIEGLDDEARESVNVLRLNHDTLKGWRKAAIESFLDPEVIVTVEDFEAVLNAVENPTDGRLPEFSFSIASVARQYLQQ